MPNTTNDEIDEIGEAPPAQAISGADEAPGATGMTSADAPNRATATSTGAVTVLKSKIFGAIKRTAGG